jgi:hypothetical protein
MRDVDWSYIGAFIFFAIHLFYFKMPKKIKPVLWVMLILVSFLWLDSESLIPLIGGSLGNLHFENMGKMGQLFQSGFQGVAAILLVIYLPFVCFMNYILLFMVGVQVAFVTRVWFKYRNEATLKNFWGKVSKYLLIRWFLGIQVPLLTAYPVLRSDASVDSETYQVIPYVWSLDNAQFRMDLNHALLLVSIPLSIAILAWWHKRYLNQHSCKESP